MINAGEVREKLVSLKDKQKNKGQYYKDVCDSYIRMSSFNTTKGKDDMEVWYKVYNGEKIAAHYSAFEDPYNTAATTNPMPVGDVKPYNIIRSNLDIIINEKEKRSWDFTVTLRNADTVSMRNMQMQKEIKDNILQSFINYANSQGMQTGIKTMEVPEIQQLVSKYKTNYMDQRAIEGQKIVNIAVSEERIQSKLNRDGMKHWCIGGEICTYKGITIDDFVYEVLNPMSVDFIQSPHVKYGRDAEAAIYRVMMPTYQIVDNMRDIISEKDLKEIIDGSSNALESLNIPVDPGAMRIMYNDAQNTGMLIGAVREVAHVVWRGYKLIGYVSYIDEFEEVQTTEVDETFDKELFQYEIIDIEWEWNTCIEECYRIDGKYYAGMGEIPYTSRKLDNTSLCPLPYNRAQFSALNSRNTSLVREAYIYQYLWNIYKAKLERIINTDHGSIAIVDKAALADWGLGNADFDKTLYYIDTLKILFIDSRRDDFGRFANWGSKIDTGQSQTILALLKVLDTLRSELDMSMGITPQRRGDVAASAGKGATEYALEKSYTVSEGIFADFEDFEEIELTDVLNIAKIAYSNNNKGMYIVDQMPVFLELEGMNIEEEELGISMSRATKDKAKLEAVRQLVQPFAQNIGQPGITPEMITNMIESDNMSQIKQYMRIADENIKAFQQQQQAQAQQELEQTAQLQREEMDMLREEKTLDREKDVLVAQIRAAGFEQETTIQDVDTSKITSEANKVREALEKNRQAREDLNFRKKQHNDTMKLKREEMASKERIEKTKLKNPVSGENK